VSKRINHFVGCKGSIPTRNIDLGKRDAAWRQGFSKRVKKARMSEMRLPSDRHVRGFHLPEAPVRISSLRRRIGQTAPEENLSIWQNVQDKDRNPLIPESLNPFLGNGIFMPPKPKVALWPVTLWPDGGKGKPS
jgi:hypothetical protein